MAKRKPESSSSLKKVATDLVQTAKQDIELAVEQLRGAASNALEKVADATAQPPKHKTDKSAKKPATRKSMPTSARAKSRAAKRGRDATAAKRGKR